MINTTLLLTICGILVIIFGVIFSFVIVAVRSKCSHDLEHYKFSSVYSVKEKLISKDEVFQCTKCKEFITQSLKK